MTVSKKYNDNLVAGGAVRDGNGNRIDTTYAKIANLASVATSGSYNDLINKPVTDQTYDGTSNNAQSGIAVEQAINTVKRNIGEVVTSTIPLTDAGLHLLDGSLISGSGVYSEFVEYIASIYDASASYFCTESDWQNSVTTYGVCGKFVYDSVNNTVRLPKITGFTEGTTDVNTLGDLTEAGLPNITGSFYRKTFANDTTTTNMTGAFTMDGSFWDASVTPSGANKDANGIVNFNASLSNPIYDNSTTVQPQSIKVLYYIVLANTTKTDIEVDIDEVVTDLNGKADTDLSNLSSTGQKVIDGQWVQSFVTIMESNGTKNGVQIDLSSYLPNDSFDYNVKFKLQGYDDDSSYYYRIETDIFDDGFTTTGSSIGVQLYGGTYSRQNVNIFDLPVGTGRYIKVYGSGADNINIYALGYRRLGTNS